ncbi:hypothetical protein VL20_2485 [Microcystis panniformis FACHB-1757]|uniref:Uncharacterized protein n=1 Tax=Microcystis panniformis FACHB-1757 TaxID=1638788 RepID=A0A0K1S0A3_9CHRO|nr:hypothetical protein VL20_2485 [Microcystis panniformis FACHB-1757]
MSPLEDNRYFHLIFNSTHPLNIGLEDISSPIFAVDYLGFAE